MPTNSPKQIINTDKNYIINEYSLENNKIKYYRIIIKTDKNNN